MTGYKGTISVTEARELLKNAHVEIIKELSEKFRKELSDGRDRLDVAVACGVTTKVVQTFQARGFEVHVTSGYPNDHVSITVPHK